MFMQLRWIPLFLLCFLQLPAQSNLEELYNETERNRKARKFPLSLTQSSTLYSQAFKQQNWEMAAKAYISKLSSLNRLHRFNDIIQLNHKSDSTKVLLKQLDEHNIYAAKAYVYEGLSNYRLSKYNSSIKRFDKALTIFKAINSKDNFVPYSYRYASYTALQLLDYQKVENYSKEILHVDTIGTSHYDAYTNLAMCYNFKKEYLQAKAYFQQGKTIVRKAPHIIKINQQGAISYAGLNNLEQAIILLKENEKIGLELTNEDDIEDFKVDQPMTYAQVYYLTKDYQKAKNYFKKSLHFNRLSSENTKGREHARLLVHIGNCFREQAQIDSALHYYQEALTEVFPNFNNTNLTANPPLEDVYRESWIMTTAGKKGLALIKKYELDNNIKCLLDAVESFAISLEVILLLKKGYAFDASKLNLGEETAAYVEGAIRCQYLLYEQTKEKQYLNKAFAIAENNKAYVLNDALRQNSAFVLANIPDTIKAKVEELEDEIAWLEGQISRQSFADSLNQHILDSLKTALASQQTAYEFLLQSIKADYPKYLDLLADKATISIPFVQEKLRAQNTAFLEFYWGEKDCFVFYITPQESLFSKIPLNENTLDIVDKFLRLVANQAAQEARPDNYFAVANQFYTKFVQMPSAGNAEQYKNLIVIPDGPLSNVPFEALVKKAEQYNIWDAPYLVRTMNIGYAYSADLCFRKDDASWQKHKKEVAKKMLAIAPRFQNREGGYAPLSFSLNEIQSINNIEISNIKSNEARLDVFRKQAPQYGLLHLSTHAVYDTSGFPPRIAFIDSSLLLPELYAMELHADLAVLSACQTSIGHYEKGEGVMSLARGFTYAGVKSLVAGLWEINEKSTSELLSGFYENFLNKGQSQAEALSQTKRAYLNATKNDAKKLPYYWAGLVFIGQETDAYSTNNIKSLLFFSGGIMFLGMLVFWWRKINV